MKTDLKVFECRELYKPCSEFTTECVIYHSRQIITLFITKLKPKMEFKKLKQRFFTTKICFEVLLL